jgi:hypothetical protein
MSDIVLVALIGAIGSGLAAAIAIIPTIITSSELFINRLGLEYE